MHADFQGTLAHHVVSEDGVNFAFMGIPFMSISELVTFLSDRHIEVCTFYPEIKIDSVQYGRLRFDSVIFITFQLGWMTPLTNFIPSNVGQSFAPPPYES